MAVIPGKMRILPLYKVPRGTLERAETVEIAEAGEVAKIAEQNCKPCKPTATADTAETPEHDAESPVLYDAGSFYPLLCRLAAYLARILANPVQ